MTHKDLNEEQRTKLAARQIGVTRGLGTGICSVAAMFVKHPILVLSVDSEMPTEEETEVLQSYLRYLVTRWWSKSLLDMPFPEEQGANTVVFTKRQDGGWAYRKMSWVSGPLFSPVPSAEPMTLLDLIEKSVESLVPAPWLSWRQENPTPAGSPAS